MTISSRRAFDADPRRISQLGSPELAQLMRRLLDLESRRCRALSPNVNVDEDTPDGGADAFTTAPSETSEWLPPGDTCWQFKAGGAGTPAKIRNELENRIPKETLRRGGHYVLVANGCKTKSGEDSRRSSLIAGAAAAKIAKAHHTHVRVIGADAIAQWVSTHPALARDLAGLPPAFDTYDRWSADPSLQGVFVGQAGEAQASSIRSAVLGGGPVHVHVSGPAGVGKTRLVLEACRDAALRGEVLYASSARPEELRALLRHLVDHPGARLVLVVDEATHIDVALAEEHVRRAAGRLQVVSIGHERVQEQGLVTIRLAPLPATEMHGLVSQAFPELPDQAQRFVVRVADGYVRFARLAAEALLKEPDIDVRALLAPSTDAGLLLKRLLARVDDASRRALHVVAVLDRIGWDNELEGEGKAVAEHLGLEWPEVRLKVKLAHEAGFIAPMAGRLRYISPRPLAIYLALEAWETNGAALRTLEDALPTERAREAYRERLRELASAPQARSHCQEELRRFSREGDLNDVRSARRWSAFAPANPSLAARSLRLRLEASSLADIRAQAANRRTLVWTLQELAWRPEAFEDAVVSLSRLALAENESWANNATGIFKALFSPTMGGTAVPFLDRLPVLDRMLESQDLDTRCLAIAALARALEQHHTRTEFGPTGPACRPEEWRPQTWSDVKACIGATLDRLRRAAAQSIEDEDDALAGAGRDAAQWLLSPLTMQPAHDFLRVLAQGSLHRRAIVRKALGSELHREALLDEKRDQEAVATAERLFDDLGGETVDDRLRAVVGTPGWESPDVEADWTAIVHEIVADPTILQRNWSWLTSGDAHEAWTLGDRLGRADSEERLLPQLGERLGRGRDLRTISAYLSARAAMRSNAAWIDDWLDGQNAADTDLLYSVTWACTTSERAAKRLVTLFVENALTPAHLAQLAFGAWSARMPSSEFRRLATWAVGRAPCRDALAGILAQRLRLDPAALGDLRDVVRDLVLDSALVHGASTLSDYHWQQLAFLLLPNDAGPVARTIFRVHGEIDGWFVDHSLAKDVLERCVKASPGTVWDELRPHLETDIAFPVGLPDSVITLLPVQSVLGWVAEDPSKRAPAIARLAPPTFEHDDLLAARVADQFGGVPRVASALESRIFSGSWSGSSADRFARLAAGMEKVAERTQLSGLRRFARATARALRREAQERQRAEEEAL